MANATTNITNKKKKGRGEERKRMAKLNKNEDNKQKTVTTMPQVKPGIFTTSQLTTLIILSIGLSRLMLLRSLFPMNSSDVVDGDNNNTSIHDEDTEVTTMTASPICVQYFGSEQICTDPTINTLMMYKYASSIQTFCLIGGLLLQIWNYSTTNTKDNTNEILLRKLNSLFTVCPMLLGLMTLYTCHNYELRILPASVFWEQSLMVFVLSMISLSGWYFDIHEGYQTIMTRFGSNTTTSTTAKQYYKSIPNICLLFLTFISVYDGYKLMQDDTELHGDDSVLQLFSTDYGTYEYWPAAKPFVYFLAIDKVMAAMIYLFAFHYLAEIQQQVRISILMNNEYRRIFLCVALFVNVQR